MSDVELEVENLPKKLQHIAKALKALGVDRVAYFNQEGGPNGMYSNVKGVRTIYLNLSSKLSMTWVAGHELGHHVVSLHPNLIEHIALAAGITKKQILARKEQMRKLGVSVSDKEMLEEMICDSFGNSITDERIYKNLLGIKDKSVYNRVLQSVIRFVNKWTGQNKLTGLTASQSKVIEDTLMKHLQENIPMYARNLQDFQNAFDYNVANDAMRRNLLGKASEQEVMDATRLMQELRDKGYDISSLKFSQDSQSVSEHWFGKIRGVLNFFWEFSPKTKFDNTVVVQNVDKDDELGWFRRFVSPNMLAAKSNLFKRLFEMGVGAQEVQERLQNQWTERKREIFANLKENKVSALSKLMHGLDLAKREPVMAVELEPGRYTLMNLQDKSEPISKRATAERRAAELRKDGFAHVLVKEETATRDGENYTTYRVLAFKEKPSSFFSDFELARRAAKRQSEEALRKGVQFGDEKNGITIVCDEEMVRAYMDMRALYDDIHDSVNQMRKRMKLEPIGYINGYMPHMFEDYWVYMGGDTSPLETFRSASDALEYAKEKTEANRVFAEANLGMLSPVMQDFAKVYYGIGRKNPITEKEELMKKFGLTKQEVEKNFAALSKVGFPDNTFRISGRPQNLSLNSERNVTAFATGDMLDQSEVNKLLEREGMTLVQFEARYGMMQDIKEYVGVERSPAIIKGRGKDMGGYMGDINMITGRYINQAARYVAVNPFKLRATALFKGYFGVDINNDVSKNTTASICKQYIQAINGEPGRLDVILGGVWDKVLSHSRAIRYVYEKLGGREFANHILFFTSITKLGLNMASAVLNLTQLANAAAVIGPLTVAKNMGRAMRVLHTLKSGTADKIIDPVTGRTMKQIIEMSGLDTQIDLSGTANLNDNTLNFGKGFMSQFVNLLKNDRVGLAYEMGNKSMWAFKQTDAWARITTALATIDKEFSPELARVQKENPSLHEYEAKQLAFSNVMKMADNNNRISNFDNSVADSALIFHDLGKLGAIMLQFKKYQFKTIELICKLGYNAARGGMEDKKKFGNLLLMQMVLSGFYGIPLYKVLLGVAAQFLGWDEPETEFKKWIWDQFGGSPIGNAVAAHLSYGIGAHMQNFGMGADLSRRTGYDFLQIQGSDMYGPTIGTVLALKKIIAENDADLYGTIAPDIMMQVFPGLGGAMQAYAGEKYTTEGRGRLIYRYSPAERAVRALGARPLLESMEADKAHYDIYYEKKVAGEGQHIKDRASRYQMRGEAFPPELVEELQKYGIKMSAITKNTQQMQMERRQRVEKTLPKKLQKDIKGYGEMTY